MASGFAPEFLILIGVDVFLGGSILTVLLDRHFPNALPYILDAGAMIGFGELLTGPSFVNNLSTELQFYYSFAYAMIAVLTLFALNLYLLFLRRRPYESAMLGVFATVPSALGMLYFTSAFVNGLTISLPVVPVIPIEGVYILFAISVGLIVFSLVVFGRKITSAGEEAVEPSPPLEEPVPARAVDVSSGRVSSMAPSSSELVNDRSEEPRIPPAPVAAAENRVAPAKAEPTPGGVERSEGTKPKTAPKELPAKPPNPPQGGGPQGQGSVLLQQEDKRDYARRLRDSIDFFSKAVTTPVRMDPEVLRGAFSDVKKAYLTPAGMILIEDSSGKTSSRSLLELSTDEALEVMGAAMKVLDVRGIGEKQA